MKTSILTSLFFGIALNAFSQNTNTTVIGPTANNQTIPIQGNAVVHHNSTVLNQSYTVSGISAPQSNIGGDHRCKTYELNQQHYQDRGIQNEFNLGYQQHAFQVTNYGVPKTAGVNEISVIFHVVHNPNNPSENVSNALIMQVFDDLVEDYQLLNANAANARSQFGFTPADCDINFCLATQDPSGNPLSEVGVVRVATNEDWYDSDNGEENKMKASATNGSQIWNRNNYLNIWICDISNGANSGTAGYAYRPNPTFLPNSGIDGIVLDYNLGVNNENVLTHEVGHYLGLDHTWGGSGGCGNDDGFNDTPISNGPSFDFPGSCSGNQQTCAGTETQYENYMDYSNCTVMFTQNQADFMLSILQGIRSSLLLSPGCDPTNTPPNSAFLSMPAGPSPVIIPVNGSVSFMDQSTNVPTGWSWTISGNQGTDWNYINTTNANSQDPQVEFYAVGTYDVSLTASNSFGSDATPASEVGYVQVVAPATGTACDTLRNWDPADASANGFFYYNPAAGGWGNIPGHTDVDGTGWLAYQYAEKFTNPGTSQVRRMEMPIFTAADESGSGTVVLKVYADDNATVAGAPGTLLASDTINIADINGGSWNEFDFTNPPSVTGTFFVGFELFYGTPQDTILVGMTQTIASGNDAFWFDLEGNGWVDSGTFGVTGSIAIDVMLSNGPDPVADFTVTDANVCPGGVISANGSSSTNVTNYFWYLTDEPFTTTIETSNTPSNNYTFPTAGDYAIYLFADGSCKTDGIYLPVTVNDPITASVSVINTTCGSNNGKIVISGEAGGDGTYYYSLDGNTYYTTSTFENLPSGTYTVYIATVGDNCEATYNVTVDPSSEFTATATGNASVCPGGSTTISATGGSNYEWYDGSTLISSVASVTVTPSTQTQYSCLVTNILGCQTTVYSTVSVVPTPTAPTITPSGSTTICAGTTVDLTSSSPTNNSWSTGETSSTITVGVSGTYSLSYLDPSGCTSSTVQITIGVTPIINITTIPIEPSSCGTATGSIEVSGTGSGDLNWTGTASGSVSGITLPYTISNLAAGSYTIALTDGNGCISNSITEALSDPTPPTTPNITPSGPAVFCDGGQLTLESSYPAGNNWSEGSSDQSITVTTSGVYTVTYTDPSGCSATSAPFTVLVNPNPSSPSITASGPITFCDGQTVLLTSSQGTGNVWSDGSTSQNNPITVSGSYTVEYTDANGCSAISDATVVTVNPLPNVNGGSDQSICEGDEVILSGSGALSFTWDNGVLDGVPFTPTATATYTGTGLDANGCSNSDQVTVTVNALPTITMATIDSVCLDADAFELLIATPTGGSYAGPGVSNNEFNAANAGVGIHSVSYSYTDANGCANSETIDIEVVECTNSIIETAAVPFEIYPNPTNKNIHIELNGLFSYELLDPKGRLLIDGSANSTIDLNVAFFESGIYFVKVTQDQKTYTVRIIKQ